MFGYVTVNKPELRIREYDTYHACYCGLCHSLQKRFGLKGQLTLSYDMTFLAMLLSALYEPEEDVSVGRCIVHPMEKHSRIHTPYTDYAADMNILLSYYNLQDDWLDGRKVKSEALALALKKSASRLEAAYPRQSRVIKECLAELASCEQQKVSSLDAASGITGRMLGEICVYEEDMWAEDLRKLGFFLGKFIYLMDAWDDREEDMKTGSYNPWLLQSGRPLTADDVTAILNMVMSECALAFERLPILRNAEILRNIIYSGVWTRFSKEQSNDV